jgi:hypothetical protein
MFREAVAALVLVFADLGSTAVENQTYIILPSSYEEVLRSEGAPIADGLRLRVRPDPFYFRWIEPGASQSPGLNFVIQDDVLSAIPDCTDPEGRLDWLSGIMGPRYFVASDSSLPAKIGLAMARAHAGFQHDPEAMARLAALSDQAHRFDATGQIETFAVGVDERAFVKVYRSPKGGAIVGVCLKEQFDLLRCNAVANTTGAGYAVDFPTIFWTKALHLECVIKALNELERRVGAREQ